ncbi:ATP-binding protein [Sulfitobacter mediterraneus]|uniref:ATP-binding protein n=1 Tax=Sulfitobacter mediterraneus TaxID=83219 RepID=UPI0021A2ADA2|nr:YhaN family protein [Sulfitobacter mediterraneus]UWR10920.1 AAA family ATPase [Sulfitobacter mediterraneus]
MRLQHLSLDLFGHFSNKTFDFGKAESGRSDFHLIYGPNEAGKTTTMEGYLRLLYGFPHREPYDFLHQRKNLKISGVLEIDGKSMAFSRLPSRTGSLLDESSTALPELALQAHLGGLSENDYRQLLCLDDDTIERGGEEIVTSHGDIGKLLFSAAAGVSSLTAVLEKFRSKADSLYRKRASSTKVAQLKKELSETEHEIKKLDVPASTLKKLKSALEVAREEEGIARNERRTLHLRKALSETIRSALPKVTEINSLEADLAPFASHPERLDINPEALVELLARQAKLKADETRLGEEVVDLNDRLKDIKRQPNQLDLLDRLDQLEDLKSRYATAELDLEKRRNSLGEIQEDMERSARDLQTHEGTDTGALRLSPSQIGKLEQVREHVRDARRDQSALQSEISKLEVRVIDAEEHIAQSDACVAPTPVVGPILNRYVLEGLAPKYATAREALRSAGATLSTALSGLTLEGQTFDNLPDCPVSFEEAEETAEEHQSLLDKKAEMKNSGDEFRRDIDILENRVAHLRNTSGLADDETALNAAADRNALWDRHKRALTTETAIAFENAMLNLDEVSEARLKHAAELGQLRHEEQRLLELQGRLKFNIDRLKELDEELVCIKTLISSRIKSAGMSVELTPALFAKWISKLDRAKQANAELKQLRANHESTLSLAERLIEELKSVLSVEAVDFEILVAEARKLEAREREIQETKEGARRDCENLKANLERQRKSLLDLKESEKAREEAWQIQVQEFFGDNVDPDILIQSLEPLRTVRELEVRRSTAARQVSAMEKDQSDFAQHIADLITSVGLAPTLLPLEAFAAIKEVGEEARAAEEKFAEFESSLKNRQEQLTQVEEALATIDRQVGEIATVFPPEIPTHSLPELRDAVRVAQGTIEKRERLSKLVNVLCTDLDASDLDEARAQLAGTSLSEISAELLTVDEDLSTVENRLEAAIENRTAAQKDLSVVTGDADVAALTQRKATLEAEIEDALLKYLETDFGSRLAEEAIRRYRDSHRSGMMEATENAFAELTNGAYTHLTTRPEGQSDVLLALDKNGMAKQAHDMSKGTRFQLYLALRAAAYEQLATQGVCLPFFCDDIFETFDEERTRAACGIMQRIGRTGQAIYLTHHLHVVRIAEEECGQNVNVHKL